MEIIANDISYDFGYICDCCGPIEGVAIKFLVFIQRWIIIMTLQLSNSSYFDDKWYDRVAKLLSIMVDHWKVKHNLITANLSLYDIWYFLRLLILVFWVTTFFLTFLTFSFCCRLPSKNVSFIVYWNYSLLKQKIFSIKMKNELIHGWVQIYRSKMTCQSSKFQLSFFWVEEKNLLSKFILIPIGVSNVNPCQLA